MNLGIPWKNVIIGAVLLGAGLGFGFMASLVLMITDEPAIIVKDQWRTITTSPMQCPDLSHTSLNEDELKTLITIMATTTSSTTTTTTKPTVSTTTSTVRTPPSTTATTLPPSTLPPSSTTLPPTTTTPETTSTTVTTVP